MSAYQRHAGSEGHAFGFGLRRAVRARRAYRRATDADNFELPTYSAPQHRACAKKPTYLLFGTPGTELRRSKKTETQAGTTANEVLLNVGLTRTRADPPLGVHGEVTFVGRAQGQR